MLALGAGLVLPGIASCGATTSAPSAPPPLNAGETNLPADDAALLADLQARTFKFFWETANPANGLVPDRYPHRPSMASVAAVGYALTAYIVGVDAGLVSREAAAQRTLATARFFATAPQGPEATGTAGYHGFFYHFLDMQTGHRYDQGVELSSQDTGLLLAGLLCAQAYFDGANATETELRGLIDQIYAAIDWPWMQQRPNLLCMGWNPKSGFKDYIDYLGFDEAMLTVLLAIASPTHPVNPAAWPAYCATYGRTWGTLQGYEHVGAGVPLFWHQFSHVWVDFRGLQDEFMRAKGLDYFENSRRATLAQQAYAVQNPMGWNDYDAKVWGLTACDGPGMVKGPDHLGRQRQFYDYRARGPRTELFPDDGTIAPAAALSSLPFAPEAVLPALRALRERFGQLIYQRYGFVDAFNTSFRVSGASLADGKYVEGFGWVDTDYVGIDQGSIVAMIANHRNGLLWKTMQRQPALRRGLTRAGFSGGWLG